MAEEGEQRSCCLFSLEKRRLRGDLIKVYTFLKRGSGAGGADLLSLMTSNRIRGNGMKLHQGKSRLDIRKRFSAERVIGPWNRLPREVVTAPSLSEFKEHLDDALSHILSRLDNGVGLVLPQEQTGLWTRLPTSILLPRGCPRSSRSPAPARCWHAPSSGSPQVPAQPPQAAAFNHPHSCPSTHRFRIIDEGVRFVVPIPHINQVLNTVLSTSLATLKSKRSTKIWVEKFRTTLVIRLEEMKCDSNSVCSRFRVLGLLSIVFLRPFQEAAAQWTVESGERNPVGLRHGYGQVLPVCPSCTHTGFTS
ncbi:hypothetical protein QYF61_020927 [Mycteria americana]|uniref:Uncharacterized protein n=1 Tax=Mycteria americana TaxID=33587 RepID=A0AAN7MUG2_MYCAM|nr:hypothetical protein QYF61_020927 [Mycteria americana]